MNMTSPIKNKRVRTDEGLPKKSERQGIFTFHDGHYVGNRGR